MFGIQYICYHMRSRCCAFFYQNTYIIMFFVLHSVNLLVLQEYWLPINALTAIMFPVIGFFEITRLQGFAKHGKVSCNQIET